MFASRKVKQSQSAAVTPGPCLELERMECLQEKGAAGLIFAIEGFVVSGVVGFFPPQPFDERAFTVKIHFKLGPSTG